MNKTMLLADDSVTIQKVVELAFADKDMEIHTASEGKGAIEKAKEINPDIILVDANLPGVNGYDFCKAIRDDDLTKKIPLLILAGAFENFDEEAGKQSGADGYLVKPFRSTDLLSRVDDLTSQKPLDKKSKKKKKKKRSEMEDEPKLEVVETLGTEGNEDNDLSLEGFEDTDFDTSDISDGLFESNEETLQVSQDEDKEGEIGLSDENSQDIEDDFNLLMKEFGDSNDDQADLEVSEHEKIKSEVETEDLPSLESSPEMERDHEYSEKDFEVENIPKNVELDEETSIEESVSAIEESKETEEDVVPEVQEEPVEKQPDISVRKAASTISVLETPDSFSTPSIEGWVKKLVIEKIDAMTMSIIEQNAVKQVEAKISKDIDSVLEKSVKNMLNTDKIQNLFKYIIQQSIAEEMSGKMEKWVSDIASGKISEMITAEIEKFREGMKSIYK